MRLGLGVRRWGLGVGTGPLLIGVFSLGVPLTGGAQEAPKPPPLTPLYWAFFVTGDNKTPLPKEEAEKMQAVHLANLGRLGREGKGLMAGPLGGERGSLRGIVVLDLPTPEAIAAEFKDDPFVKAGYMKLEPHKWLTVKDRIKKPNEPFSLQECRLVIYKKGPAAGEPATDQSRKDGAGHLKLLEAMDAAGELALAGPLVQAGDMRGILVFRITDIERIKARLAEDPLVRSGRLVYESYQLFVGKGVLGEPAAK